MKTLTNNSKRFSNLVTLTSLATATIFTVGLLSNAQAQNSISFSIDNFYGNPSCGPEMFTDQNGILNPDPGCDPCGPLTFTAFEQFGYNNGLGFQGEAATTSSVFNNNMPVAALAPADVGNTSLIIDQSFGLSSFEHTADQNDPATFGSWGDHRQYVGGHAYIVVDGDTVLEVGSITFDLWVNYPAPFGQGDISSGFGMGYLYGNDNDPNWVAALDPQGTGQINFNLNSISPTAIVFPPNSPCQTRYGYYDVNVTISPNAIPRIVEFGELPFGNGALNFQNSQVDFNFEMGIGGGEQFNQFDVMAMRVEDAPEGNLPEGINSIEQNHFWHLGTTMESFETDVTFDLADITLGGNPSNYRILRKPDGSNDWEIFGDISLLNGGTELRANNVTGFSDWAVGDVGDGALPVELQSFEASTNGKNVELTWTTATETDNKGFVVERSLDGKNFIEIASYKTNTALIGRGTSASETNYKYTDSRVSYGSTYHYRLVDVSYEGIRNENETIRITVKSETSESAIVNLDYELQQNFPNPFNPSTQINFSIARAGVVTLNVYNVSGQLVKTLVNNSFDKGNYNVEWNGTNSNGSQVSSGVYLYKLTTSNGFSATKKMFLIK